MTARKFRSLKSCADAILLNRDGELARVVESGDHPLNNTFTFNSRPFAGNCGQFIRNNGRMTVKDMISMNTSNVIEIVRRIRF